MGASGGRSTRTVVVDAPGRSFSTAMVTRVAPPCTASSAVIVTSALAAEPAPSTEPRPSTAARPSGRRTDEVVVMGEPFAGRRGHRGALKALTKRSRKALIGQTGAWGPGLSPSCQPQPEIWSRTAGSWATIVIGTSGTAPSPATIGIG